MDLLPKYFGHIKIVDKNDRVYKDECIYSYDTPESDDGLYICMKSFEAVGSEFLNYYFERYGHAVYLNHRRLKYKLNKPETCSENTVKPKRLAIGLEGGFDPDASSKDYRIEDTYSLLILPDRVNLPIPNAEFPELVLSSIQSIISAESSKLKDNSTSVWDGEQRQVTKYADYLEQITPAPKIPPSNWKCEKCDLKENLWLNLTDGSILCGRRFFDGSGGNNHAVDHYEEVKHPLAVKLGTITVDSADVYSYPEGDMVIDPKLDQHLAHFGIDIQSMTKTEKSMLELEIDINEKLGEWSVIQEEGKNLQPVSGPGFTGLENLGNSCYMNSVLQVLFSLDEFQTRYFPPLIVYQTCDGQQDFNHQMAKLAFGLLSGKYSELDPVNQTQKGIAPHSFKQFVCGSDRNFSTKRQQDAHEFFLFLMNLIERSDKDSRDIAAAVDKSTAEDDSKLSANNSTADPSKCLEFVIEDRIQCSESKKVKYTHRVESCLSLHVDLEMATNKEEILVHKEKFGTSSDGESKIEPIRPVISLKSCIELYAKAETITEFYSTAISAQTTAEKSSKISKFPRCFVFHMKKFQCDSNWVPKKLDVAFDVPDILDLEFLEGRGLQDGEEELEEQTETASNPATGGASSGAQSSSGPSIEPDSEAVAMLLSMGIDVTRAIEALKLCNNDAQRAIEYIFDPDSFNAQQQQQPSNEPSASRLTVATRADPLKMKLYSPDSNPKLYQLKAFISHMGQSTMCGHYVCHIKKDERWYIYNDNKVAVSENPPREFGYLYFYERVLI